MAPKYAPLVSDVTMSDYGYWVVTISVSPYQRMAVMIAVVGISPDEAASLAIGQLATLNAPRRSYDRSPTP